MDIPNSLHHAPTVKASMKPFRQVFRLGSCMLSPLAKDKWTFTEAAHLLNRAGFGGPPAEIEKLAALGPEKAVSHLVDYENIPDDTSAPSWAKPDPERAEKLRTARQ